MRYLLLLIVVALLPEWASAQNVDANFRLTGFFPFADCSGHDPSGNSNASLDSTTTCACGVSDLAPVFDGPEDKMFLTGGVASVFGTTNFTVSFYMKPNDPPPGLIGSTQMVMSKQDGCNNNNAFWVRYRRRGQTNLSSNVISTGLSQNDSLALTLSAKLDDDRCWYHIVLVRDATKYILYVDGEKRDEKTASVRVDVANNTGFSISEPKCPLDTCYYGQLDEIRFYSRAYTPDEIKNLLALHPDRILTNDTLIYLGNTLRPQIAPTCANAFVWSPASGIANISEAETLITPDVPTDYVLRFNHPDGCAAYDTLKINVIDPDTLDCEKIFIPNAFTPGFSLGRNDRFFVSNAFAITDFISFEIFDRWGGRVFNAESVGDSWDGTFDGKACNPGLYLYRLRYRCKGAEKLLSGTVSLLR